MQAGLEAQRTKLKKSVCVWKGIGAVYRHLEETKPPLYPPVTSSHILVCSD